MKKSEATLTEGEPHPMAFIAKDYIMKVGIVDLLLLREAMASCSIEGNRTSEICGATLDRLLTGQPVSDRYIMGLFIHILLIRGELKDE